MEALLRRLRPRADGAFDLAVNGGGRVTVDYQKEGYLPVQRQILAPWRDYVTLPDVALVALDGSVEVRGPNGQRTVPLIELHRLPGDTPHIETVLEPGEVIRMQRSPRRLDFGSRDCSLAGHESSLCSGTTGPNQRPAVTW